MILIIIVLILQNNIFFQKSTDLGKKNIYYTTSFTNWIEFGQINHVTHLLHQTH